MTMVVLLPAINFFLNNIAKIRIGKLPISIVLYSILSISIVYALYKVNNNRIANRKAYKLTFAVILLSLFSYIIYYDSIGYRLIAPDFNPIYSELLYLILFCIPAFLLSSSIIDWKLVLYYLSLFAPVVIGLSLYAYYLMGFSVYGEGKMDYMSLSYYVLTSACICLYKALDKENIFYGVISLVGLFIILAAGCRGALICYLLFVIIIIYSQITEHSKTKSTRFLKLTITATVLFAIFSTAVSINSISHWFGKIGISSRSVLSLQEGSFFESYGRDLIRESIENGILDNPFGYGLFGDRYITSKYYTGTEYAHNLFIEFFADFGVIGGLVLLLWIFFSIIKFYRNNKKSYLWFVLLIFLPEGLFELFFSGSFLTVIPFWIVLGLLMNKERLSLIGSK